MSRPSRAIVRSLSLVIPLLSAVSTPAARADNATAEQTSSARALGIEGVRLAEAGDCANAIDKLSRAEAIYHAPTTLERLGECQVTIGRLVEGTESLNRVVREQLAPAAPAPFFAAQTRAHKLLEMTAPRIAKLRIHVDGAPAAGATVKVDGDSVPAALLDAERPTDPGAHKVTAIADGYQPAAAAVSLKDGESASVTLRLEALAGPPPTAATNAPSGQLNPSATPAANPTAEPGTNSFNGQHETADAAPAGRSNTLAYVSLGVGAAGIVAGGVFGVLALGTKSSLDNACPAKTCPSNSQTDIDALHTQSLVANIGFGVGIVGLGVGSILLLTAPRATNLPRSGVRVVPWIGATSGGVKGTF